MYVNYAKPANFEVHPILLILTEYWYESHIPKRIIQAHGVG